MCLPAHNLKVVGSNPTPATTLSGSQTTVCESLPFRAGKCENAPEVHENAPEWAKICRGSCRGNFHRIQGAPLAAGSKMGHTGKFRVAGVGFYVGRVSFSRAGKRHVSSLRGVVGFSNHIADIPCVRAFRPSCTAPFPLSFIFRKNTTTPQS